MGEIIEFPISSIDPEVNVLGVDDDCIIFETKYAF